MGIKSYKPTSPGRRHGSVLDYQEITTQRPEKSLLEPLKKTGGRNNVGRITSRRRGGGHKRKYRVIDWKRNKDGVPAVVKTIEYDPNRSANIALLFYADGDKRYIQRRPVGARGGEQRYNVGLAVTARQPAFCFGSARAVGGRRNGRSIVVAGGSVPPSLRPQGA